MESSTLRHNGPDDERSASVLRVPVEPGGVATVRAQVTRAAQAAQLSADRIDDLVIATSEAVTNAIEAQERAGTTSPIEVRCTVTARQLVVEVIDAGDGLELGDLHVRPPLDDPGHLDIERGWGVQLMRELVDDLEFDLTTEGTTVRLRMVIGD